MAKKQKRASDELYMALAAMQTIITIGARSATDEHTTKITAELQIYLDKARQALTTIQFHLAQI